MAFPTPVAMQNIATATTGLRPSMFATLRGPMQGLARQQTRAVPRLAPFQSFAAKHFSTKPRMGPLSFSHIRPLPQVGNVGLALAQQRNLFRAFGGPSASTLARLEQAANSNPNSSSAQSQFNTALLNANRADIVIERYRSQQFAGSPTVDNAYIKAMQILGQSNSGPLMNHGHNGQNLNQGNYNQQAIGQAVGAHVAGSHLGVPGNGNNGNHSSGAKGDPVYVVVEQSLWATVFTWVRWLCGFALMVYIVMVIVSVTVETSGLLKKVGGAGGPTAEVKPEQQKTRFSDVHGCDEAKEELQDVVDFLKNPDRYNKLGGRLPKGVLLIGPPGTGKTLLARAVAGEAGVPFFYMSGSEFDEVYVGVGAKRVRELFAQARTKAPAIVFIDELDAVGGKRNSRDANYHRQTLNQLLNDLDGFDQQTGVIFIAATNHPELLDKALTRPGRFDRHVSVELPDVRGRLAILNHHFKKIRLGPDVDLTKIARGTPGFSGAELENLANTAAIQASKHMSKFVKVDDVEWAKDKIMMGSERKARTVPLKDRQQTAYHEGGHALVGLYTKGYSEVHKATILPRGHAAGITFFLPQEENHHRSKAQYMVDLQVSMGGRMAEELIYGPDNVGDGASSDIQQATRLAYAMVTSYGFSDLLGNVDFRSNYEMVSPATKQIIDNEVRRLIDEASTRTRELLINKREELHRLATALVQYETLDKDEIVKVIKGEKLPDRLMAAPDIKIKIPEIPIPRVALPPPASGSSEPPSGSAGGLAPPLSDKASNSNINRDA